MKGVGDVPEHFRRRAAWLCVAALSLQVVAPLGVLATPGILTVPGAGASREPLGAMQFNVPGFGDLSEAVNVANGNLYLAFDGISHNNLLGKKDEDPQKTIAGSGWNVLSRLRLDGFDAAKVLASYPDALSLVSGDSSRSSYSRVSQIPDGAPDWITRYKGLAAGSVRVYQLDSEPGKSYRSSWIVLLAGATGRGVLAHAYTADGLRSTFSTDGEYVDYTQTPYQQYRSANAPAKDPEGAAASSPKTELRYLAANPGLLSSIRDEWGRTTLYTWDTSTKVVTSVASAFATLTPTATSKPGRSIALTYVTVSGQQMISQVTYGASDGQNDPAAPVMLNRVMKFEYETKAVGGQNRVLLSKVIKPAAGTGGKRLTTTYGYDDGGRVISYKSLDDTGTATEPETTYSYAQPAADATEVTLAAVPTPEGQASAGGTLSKAVLYADNQYVSFTAPKAGLFDLRLNAFGSNYLGWPRIAVALNGTRVSEFTLDQATAKNFNLGSMDLKLNDVVQLIFINDACCGPRAVPGGSPVDDRNVYLNTLTFTPAFPDASNRVSVVQGNKKNVYLFDSAGQLVLDSQRDFTPNGGTADADRTLYHRYRYYPDGNVGLVTEGYLVNSVYHDGKTIHMAYDPAGNLIRQAEYATPQNFDGTIGLPLSLTIDGFKSDGTKTGYNGLVQLGQTFTLTTTVLGDPSRKGVQWSAGGAAVSASSSELQTLGSPVVSALQGGKYTVTQSFTTAPLKAARRERNFELKAASLADPSVAATYKVFVSSPVLSISVNIGGIKATDTRGEKLIIAPNCIRRFGLSLPTPAFLDSGCKSSLAVQPVVTYSDWALNPPTPTFTATLDTRSVTAGARLTAGTPNKATGLSLYSLTVPWKDMDGRDDILTMTVSSDVSGPINLPFNTGYFGIRKAPPSTGIGQWNAYGDEYSSYQYAVAVYNSPDPSLALRWTIVNGTHYGNGCVFFGSSGGFFGGGRRAGRVTASVGGYPQLSLTQDTIVYTKFSSYDTGEGCLSRTYVQAFPGGLVGGKTFSSAIGSGPTPGSGTLGALGLGQQFITLSTQTTAPVQTGQTGTALVVKQVLSSDLQPGYTHYESSVFDVSNRLTLKTTNAPEPISAGGLTHQYQDVSDKLAYGNFSATVSTASGKQTFVVPKTVTTTHAVGSSVKTTSVATLDDAGLLTRQKLSWGTGGTHFRQTNFVYLRDRAAPTTSYTVPRSIDGVYSANSYAQFQVRQHGDQMYWRYEDTATGSFQHSVQYFYDQFGHVVRELKYGVASGLSTTPVSLTTANEVVNRAYDGYDNQFWSQTTLDFRVTREQGWSYDAAGALHSTWLGTPNRLTTFSYDNGGRLTGKQSGVGDNHAGVDGTLKTVRSSVDYTLDEFGRIKEQKLLRSGTSPVYDTTKFTYDTLDRVASKTLPDAGASVIKTWYDDLGQQRLIQEPYSTHSWQRDTLGRVLQETVTPAAGHGVASSTSFTYDPYGRVIVAETADTSINSGASDRQTVYRYDSEGREVLRIGAALRTVADASGSKSWLTDARRPSAVTSYDELGRKTSLLSGLYATALTSGNYANAGDAARTSYSYDDLDRLIGSIDAEGYETRLSYDGADRLTKTERQVWTGTESTDTAKLGIDKALYATSWTVSLNDQQPLVAVDPTGARVERRYNRAGDLTADLSQQKAGGTLIIRHAYTYTEDGLPLGVWEPKSGTAPTTFDPGRPGASFDATSTSNYSTGELPSSMERKVNDGTTATSSFEYTWQGKPSKVTAPDASVTTSEYDYLGNVTRMTDRNEFTTESVYDTGGHQLSVKQLARSRTVAGTFDGDEIDQAAGLSSGLTSSYTYDAEGNLIRKNERHLVTDYVYNSMGKVIAESRPTYQATEPPAYPMKVLYRYFAYRLDGQRVAETTATYSDGGELETAQAKSGGLDSTSVSSTAQKSGGLSVTRYDLIGRVTRVTNLGYPVNSTGTTRLTETDSTFTNNGLGMRVQRSFTGSPEVAVNQRDPATGGFLTVTGQPLTSYQSYWKYNVRGDLGEQWNEVATPTSSNSKFNSFSYTYSPTGKRLSASRNVQLRLLREAGGTRLNSDPLLAASVGRVESDYNERDLLKTTRVFDQSPTTISSLETAPTTPQRTTDYVYYPDGSRKRETTSTGSKTTSYDLLGRPATVSDSNGSSVTRYTADQKVPDGAGSVKVSRKVGTGAATITYAYTPLSTTVTTTWASPPKGATVACSISRTTTPTVRGLTYQETETDSCDPERASLSHTLRYTDRGLAVSDQTSTNGSYDPGDASAIPARPSKGESFNIREILYNSDNTVAKRTIDTGSYVNGYTYNYKNATSTIDNQNTAKTRVETTTFSPEGFLTQEKVDINDNTCLGGFLSNGNCVYLTSSGKTTATAPKTASATGPVKVAIVSAAPDPNHTTVSYALDSRGDRLSVKGGPNDGYIKRYDADGQVAMFYRYDQALKRGAYSDFLYDPEGQQVLTANSAFVHDGQGYTLTRNQSSTYSADGEVQLIRKREGVLADTGATYFLWWQTGSGKSDSYAANDLLRDQTYSLADGLADVNDWNTVVLFDSKAGFNAPIVFQAPTVSTSSSTGLDPATVKPPSQVTPPATSPGSTEVTPPVAPPAVVKQGSTGKTESAPATTGSIGSGQAAGTVVTIGTVAGTTPATAPVKPVASAASGTTSAAPVPSVTPAQASGKDASGVVLLPPQNVLPPSAQAVTVQEVQAPGTVNKTPVPVLSEAGGTITAPNQVKLPAVVANPSDGVGAVIKPSVPGTISTSQLPDAINVIPPSNYTSNQVKLQEFDFIKWARDYIDSHYSKDLSTVSITDRAKQEKELGLKDTVIQSALVFRTLAGSTLGEDTTGRFIEATSVFKDPEVRATVISEYGLAVNSGHASLADITQVIKGLNDLGEFERKHPREQTTATMLEGLQIINASLYAVVGGSIAGLNTVGFTNGTLIDAYTNQFDDYYTHPGNIVRDAALYFLGGYIFKGIASVGGRVLSRLSPEAQGAFSRVGKTLNTDVRRLGRAGCNSFTPNTPVRTLAGLVAIGSLTIGTQVLAFNEQTGQNEYDPITAVHRNIDPTITYLTLKDGKTGQPEAITTTPEHPFYVQTQADSTPRPKPIGHEDLNSHWVGAGHLQIGDKIKQIDGSMGAVANVVTVQQTQEMFNLTVDEAHTFYVGQDGWLVHNTGGPGSACPIPSRTYDRPDVEIKSGTALKQKDATAEWDKFLGPNSTHVDPRDGLPDPDRIWSADGLRSIRFGAHEMNSRPNLFHFHFETWSPNQVSNVLQRMPK